VINLLRSCQLTAKVSTYCKIVAGAGSPLLFYYSQAWSWVIQQSMSLKYEPSSELEQVASVGLGIRRVRSILAETYVMPSEVLRVGHLWRDKWTALNGPLKWTALSGPLSGTTSPQCRTRSSLSIPLMCTTVAADSGEVQYTCRASKKRIWSSLGVSCR